MEIPRITKGLHGGSTGDLDKISMSSFGLSDNPTKLEDSIEQFLLDLGLDPRNNKDIQETPRRFTRAMHEMTMGYQATLEEIVSTAVFEEDSHSKYVVVPSIAFSSLCEHHMLPMFGKVYIAYIPNKLILGLSKFSRDFKVRLFSKETVYLLILVQERFTKQVAEAIYSSIKCKFIIVEVAARHSCMFARGAKEIDCLTRTLEHIGTCADVEKKELTNLLERSFKYTD